MIIPSKKTPRIRDKSVLQKVAKTIANVQRAQKLEEIKNLKKIQGTTSMYRIRIGDYRLGIMVIESSVEFNELPRSRADEVSKQR